MINSWTMGNRLPFFIEIKMKLRAILEGRWYTGRNAHQIWAEWAVWARWQFLNGSQFLFHFNDKWLSVDNISWIYYQICLDIFEIAVFHEIKIFQILPILLENCFRIAFKTSTLVITRWVIIVYDFYSYKQAINFLLEIKYISHSTLHFVIARSFFA